MKRPPDQPDNPDGAVPTLTFRLRRDADHLMLDDEQRVDVLIVAWASGPKPTERAAQKPSHKAKVTLKF